MRFRGYLLTEGYITEKQIIIKGTKGKRFGNIVILAGGGASGKGFAHTHFLEGDLYKTRDIDEYKKAFMKIAKAKNKYPEIRDLDLTNPDDVFTLHEFVKKKGIKGKTLNLLLKDLREAHLPNILFDITFQHIGKVKSIVNDMLTVGYKPVDVNIVWVLTDYSVAVAQNRSKDRGRIVPEDVLLLSHAGAALNMHDMISKGVKGLGRKQVDGEINVILGGKKHTVFWRDKNNKIIKTKPSAKAFKKIYGEDPPKDFLKPQPVIKDFKYLKVKSKGKSITSDENVRKQLHSWIVDSIPKCMSTAHIWRESAVDAACPDCVKVPGTEEEC